MKRLLSTACALALGLLFLPSVLGSQARVETLHYGFEIGEKLIGYVETTITPPSEPGAPCAVDSILFAKMTLLGQDFDLHVEEHYTTDPATGMVLRQSSRIEQGTMIREVSSVREDDHVTFDPGDGGAKKTVSLDGGVVLEDPLRMSHLLRALPRVGDETTVPTYDYNSGLVRDSRYERKADTVFLLEGVEIPCATFESTDATTGITGEILLELGTGSVMRMTLSNGILIQRAAPGVVGKIKRAELDELILAPVDVAIADFQAITYMKVEAKLDSVGEVLSVESLNVPGQRFTGTVEGSRVEGVFEIEHPRYDGAGAPPFPPDFGEDSALAKYLERETLIESDDPVLVAKARELTAGAKSSWDAAVRLARWVGDEITYEIPGGSALSTFDARKGECGSHSRLLVAFCRAVGVPARLVSGGMYVPNYGGSFGQHAWTEVYMGEAAGWIPVDSTVKEADYVDSGHLRLGTNAGFSPKELEVLDYRLRGEEPGRAVALGSFLDTPWKVGETHTYDYTLDGQALGTDSFTIESIEEVDGRRILTCRASLALTGRTLESTLRLEADGRPVAYHAKGRAGTVEYSIDCEFGEEKVVEKATQAGKAYERTIELPKPVWFLENNHFAGYALLLAAVPRTAGAELSFKVFHPTSMQLLPVQIRVGEVEPQGRRVDLNIAGTALQLWVDADGRLVRDEEAGGRMVVELRPSAGR